MRNRSMLVLSTLIVAGSAWAATEADLVKYRENGMDVLGGHMGSIAAIVKGEVPYTADLASHAQGLAAQAKLVKGAFETRAMDDETEALEKIWDDWDDFAEKADALEKAADEFAVVAASGDMAAVRAKLGAVGKACKSCHDKYKEE